MYACDLFRRLSRIGHTPINCIADYMALIVWEDFSPSMPTAYKKVKQISTTTCTYLRLPKARLFHVNSPSFNEKDLSPVYNHWAFLLRDIFLPLVRTQAKEWEQGYQSPELIGCHRLKKNNHRKFFTSTGPLVGPCIQPHNMTSGGFHGNPTYATMLGLEIHIHLTDYKFPRDPPSINWIHVNIGSNVGRIMWGKPPQAKCNFR